MKNSYLPNHFNKLHLNVYCIHTQGKVARIISFSDENQTKSFSCEYHANMFA